jgi:hypothetical protein
MAGRGVIVFLSGMAVGGALWSVLGVNLVLAGFVVAVTGPDLAARILRSTGPGPDRR